MPVNQYNISIDQYIDIILYFIVPIVVGTDNINKKCEGV